MRMNLVGTEIVFFFFIQFLNLFIYYFISFYFIFCLSLFSFILFYFFLYGFFCGFEWNQKMWYLRVEMFSVAPWGFRSGNYHIIPPTTPSTVTHPLFIYLFICYFLSWATPVASSQWGGSGGKWGGKGYTFFLPIVSSMPSWIIN